MKRSSLALAAICVGWPLMVSAGDGPNAQATSVGPVESVGAEGSALPSILLDALTATRERPLFSPSRRPNAEASAPEAEAAPVAPVPFDFVLTGIVSSPQESMAVLVQGGGTGPVQAKVDDVVGGWTVIRIGPDAVVMKNGDGEERTLSMFGHPEALSEGADGSKVLSLGAAAPATDMGGIAPVPPGDTPSSADPSPSASEAATVPAPIEPPQEHPIQVEPRKARRVF